MGGLAHVVAIGMAFLGGLGRGSDGPGEIVASALAGERAALHRCWERAASDDFRLAGVLVVRATLDPKGKVTAAEVVSDGAGDTVLATCVLDRARAMRFANVGVDELEIPFEFVAPASQTTVRSGDVTPEGPVAGLVMRSLLTRRSVGATDVSLALVDADAGAKITTGGTEGVAIVVALAGGLDLPGGKLGVGGAAYLAGQVVLGTARGKTQLLHLTVAAKPATPATTVAARKDRRPLVIGGGKGSVTILFDAELARDPSAYVGWLVARRGMAAPTHTHDASVEILYVTKGSGTMTVAGEVIQVEAGMAVHIPKATPHSFEAGPKGLEAVQFYAPAGPEQRFYQGASGPSSSKAGRASQAATPVAPK